MSENFCEHTSLDMYADQKSQLHGDLLRRKGVTMAGVDLYFKIHNSGKKTFWNRSTHFYPGLCLTYLPNKFH